MRRRGQPHPLNRPLRRRRAFLRVLCAGLLWEVSTLLAGVPTASAHAGAFDLAYVTAAGTDGRALAIIDIARRSVAGSVRFTSAPWGVALSADARDAYLTLPDGNELVVVDARERRVVATVPTGARPQAVALVPARTGGALYVANADADTVSVVDPDSYGALATLQVGLHPVALAVAGPDSGIADPDDIEAYVANGDAASLSIVGANERGVVATLALPDAPIDVLIPPTGGVAYVATRRGSVLAVGLSERRVLGTLVPPDGARLGAMDYDTATGNIYVPDVTAGALLIVPPVVPDAVPSAPLAPRRVPLARPPTSVAITSDGALGLVAQPSAGQVALLDLPARTTLAMFAVGGAPRQVVPAGFPPAFDRQGTFAASGVLGALALLLAGALFVYVRRQPKRGAVAQTPSGAVGGGDEP